MGARPPDSTDVALLMEQCTQFDPIVQRAMEHDFIAQAAGQERGRGQRVERAQRHGRHHTRRRPVQQEGGADGGQIERLEEEV